MKKDEKPICPHCGEKLKKWTTPSASTWNSEFQYVCFNDKCTYFVNGWKWMMEKYNVNSSYRYRYDPTTGESGPVPVWSYDALKADIIEEEES